MPTSDTSEKGLESLIFNSLTGYGSSTATGAEGVREAGSVRYLAGDPEDYDRDHAVDIDKLLAFLETTQPKVFAQLGIAAECPARLKFLARLHGEIAKRGVVDVLRKGDTTRRRVSGSLLWRAISRQSKSCGAFRGQSL